MLPHNSIPSCVVSRTENILFDYLGTEARTTKSMFTRDAEFLRRKLKRTLSSLSPHLSRPGAGEQTHENLRPLRGVGRGAAVGALVDAARPVGDVARSEVFPSGHPRAEGVQGGGAPAPEGDRDLPGERGAFQDHPDTKRLREDEAEAGPGAGRREHRTQTAPVASGRR